MSSSPLFIIHSGSQQILAVWGQAPCQLLLTQRWANLSKLPPSWSSLPRKDKDLIHQLQHKIPGEGAGSTRGSDSASISLSPSFPSSSLSHCPSLFPKLLKLISKQLPHPTLKPCSHTLLTHSCSLKQPYTFKKLQSSKSIKTKHTFITK